MATTGWSWENEEGEAWNSGSRSHGYGWVVARARTRNRRRGTGSDVGPRTRKIDPVVLRTDIGLLVCCMWALVGYFAL